MAMLPSLAIVLLFYRLGVWSTPLLFFAAFPPRMLPSPSSRST